MALQDNLPSSESGLVLALSGGGAAGLAHIGVLQMLAENAIPVRAVVGSSIGAEIGAFAASGMPIAELVNLATAFDWKQTLQLFMPDLPTGGLVSGKKIMDFLNTKLGPFNIESLSMGYAALTTDLDTGELLVLDQVLDITQAEIVRLRSNTNPPDLMLAPDVGRIGSLDFYRGKEAIAAGQAATREKIGEIKSLLEIK